MNKRLFLKTFISIIAVVVAFSLSITLGAEKINLFALTKFTRIIVFDLRLPRALLVLLTGILLGGSGAVFQLFFRNPLAEPGIMGISSGATLGAVIASVSGLGTTLLLSSVNVAAFVGALISGVVVILFASGKNKQESTVMLLLCGTALGTLYSAVSSVILFSSDKDLRSIYSWILGSFNGRGWKEFFFIIIPALIAFCVMVYIAPSLDLLSGGEKSALALGVEVDKLRILVLITGALCVSAAVCAGGTISFVGLIAPHIVRKIFDSKAKILIPFSMIFGAVLLLLADTIARVVIAPAEIPAGVITAILGAPFFLSLCIKRKFQV